MYADFACLCSEYEAFNADEVADVEQSFEDLIIHVLVFAGADVVACDINLYSSL